MRRLTSSTKQKVRREPTAQFSRATCGRCTLVTCANAPFAPSVAGVDRTPPGCRSDCLRYAEVGPVFQDRNFRGRAKLSQKEIASLNYMLELVETAERIGRKNDFEFLSYLLSLSRQELLDVLNHSAAARSRPPRTQASRSVDNHDHEHAASRRDDRGSGSSSFPASSSPTLPGKIG